MRGYIRFLWIVGFFGLLATAEGQTQSPSPTVTAFDGTYAFVSATKVNETYTGHSGQMGQCPYRTADTLTIVKGVARYRSGFLFKGTVRSQGELAMRAVPPAASSTSYIDFPTVSGNIDGTGMVRARQNSYFCSYDMVWRKVSK
jgi:hypothetical protein